MHLSVKAFALTIAIAFSCATRAHAEEDAGVAWTTPMLQGNEVMSHLLVAVSGKPNSEKTDALLVGVKSIVREEKNFRLIRDDGAELVVPRDTHMGEKMFTCMEKIERQARKKVGDELADYVKSVDALNVEGDGIVLHHSGEESVCVPLPTNQPWLPVKLKELRLKHIRLQLVDGKGFDVHRIKNIDGIAAVVEIAGADLKVEPREFWRYRDKKGNTRVVLGVQSLIPKPVRSLLHLPDVVHVHYTFKKKHKKAQQEA
jgi:hypothetical protein